MCDTAWHEPLSGAVRGSLELEVVICKPAGVRFTVSWWQPEWRCPSDLLSGIPAVPAKLASEIDGSLMNTHLMFFPRHVSNYIYDCTCAWSINDRTRLLCVVLFFPESARGPKHLVAQPGPLAASRGLVSE